MNWEIKHGDWIEVLKTLPSESVQCCVTSPPFWGLRDYGVAGQLGLERTPEEFVAKMVEGFREVRRVLRNDGTCWINLGDSYASNGGHTDTNCNDRRGQYRIGTRPDHEQRAHRNRAGLSVQLKTKDLVGIPWMVAFALRADGWYLRMDVVWNKKNPMPESVTDRPTKAHEYIFLLSKSEQYFYDAEAIKESASEAKKVGANSRENADRDPAHLIGRSGNKQRVPASQRGVPVDDGGKTVGSVASGVPWAGNTRNKRSVWEVATAPFAEAHFATFPPKLIEPCILAGTSEKGCCAKCGAPIERVTETDRSFESGSGKSGNTPQGKLAGGTQVREDHDIRMGPTVTTRTLGWTPTCTCAAGEPVPCTVLDPFNGAGTTGLVATRFGRSYIGIELNPQYIEMAERRIVGDAPLFNTPTSTEAER